MLELVFKLLSYKKVKVFAPLFWFGLLGLLSVNAGAGVQQKSAQDFHMKIYTDAQGSAQDFELFTKVEEREVFLGLSCASMSPFPLLQVLLFNDEVVSESPRLMEVRYRVIPESELDPVELQGILKVVDNVDEFSNKIRLELASGQMRSMSEMQAAYAGLLSQLMQSDALEVTLSHRSVGRQTYRFSLKGLKPLLTPHQSLCR